MFTFRTTCASFNKIISDGLFFYFVHQISLFSVYFPILFIFTSIVLKYYVIKENPYAIQGLCSHFAKDIILCENDIIINNQTEVAETFTNFFVNVAKDIGSQNIKTYDYISLFSVYFPILFIFISIVFIK
jgi:hypothetical protein